MLFHPCRSLVGMFFFVVGWCCPLAWIQAETTINNLSLRGLQVGATTTITVTGTDLMPGAELVLPFPIAKQTVQAGSHAGSVTFEVILDAAVPVGIYPLRVVSEKGISSSLAIGVDTLLQRPYVAEVSQLPVALSGNLTGNTIHRTRFTGREGQRIVVDVESKRLGAKLKPIVRLLDEQGKQLAWSPARGSIDGDSRCEAILPTTGQYAVELHDVLYRGAAPGHYRMKIGSLQFADLVLPLGVQLGSEAQLKPVSSSFSASSIFNFDAGTLATPQIDVATIPNVVEATGAAPRVTVSDHREILEAEAGAVRQEVPLAPIAISGRIADLGEQDQYLLAVTPGMRLRFDVQAQRLGSRLDGVLSLLGEQGNSLATNDDRPNTSDPGLDYTVPGNMQQLVIALQDLQGRGGDEFVYRIVVSDLSRPEFSLRLTNDRFNVSASNTQVFRVDAERTSYDGPIALRFDALPPGVTVSGAEIAAGSTVGLVALTAPPQQTHALVSLHGEIEHEGQTVRRMAETAETEIARYQPLLRQRVAMAISNVGQMGLAWTRGELNPQLVRGAKLAAALSLKREAGVTGDVRIRLLTTQIMPRKTVKQDNKDVEVDDLERALRLEGMPMFTGEATEVTANVLVPADLQDRRWGLVFVAELLSADKKAVISSCSSEVIHFGVGTPIALELGEPKVEARAGLGETGALAGKVNRTAGFDKPVVIQLESLPDGFVSPSVEVPGDQSEFILPVRFPYGSPAGELKNVQLVATSQPDPNNAALVIRSNTLGVTINVVPGEKPPAEQPLTVFEDEDKFIGYLSKGGGQISLEAGDKYSGKVSAKVTPDQRFNESVPGWNIKVRQNPGPNEFRFLRFAWKKKGGATICLQLNHDGQWGPSANSKPGAKFRYHAGPGGECYNGSVVVDANLPSEFVVVTRDLFADFGAFTLSGIAFTATDGEYALFDHLYLGKSIEDFELVSTATAAP